MRRVVHGLKRRGSGCRLPKSPKTGIKEPQSRSESRGVLRKCSSSWLLKSLDGSVDILRIVQLDSPFAVHSNTLFRSLGALRCSLLLALLITGAVVPAAKADFVSPYALGDFTLVNSTPSDNGTAVTPDGGRTVVLTGPNDGSGLPGFTELTVLSRGTGLFRFDYVYTSLDTPNGDFAGYILNGRVVPLASASGQSGTVSVAVRPGDRIGFRIDTVDNIA